MVLLSICFQTFFPEGACSYMYAKMNPYDNFDTQVTVNACGPLVLLGFILKYLFCALMISGHEG